MSHFHELSFVDWALASAGIIAGVVILSMPIWAIQHQREFDERGVRGLVRTSFTLGSALLLVGFGYIFSDWAVLLGVLLMVFGVVIPNTISRRRADFAAMSNHVDAEVDE